jgi:hypothetical protein
VFTKKKENLNYGVESFKRKSSFGSNYFGTIGQKKTLKFRGARPIPKSILVKASSYEPLPVLHGI